MSIAIEALKYVARNALRSTMIATNCRRFARLIGPRGPDEITAADLQAFRDIARAQGLSHVTIEKTLTDVVTIVKHCTGTAPAIGRRLPQKPPAPQPVSLADISATWQASPDWLQQWITIAYWTGLRLRDAMGLQLSLPIRGDAIRWQASKTDRAHVYPLPDWLRPRLQALSLPYTHTGGHSVKHLRRHLDSASEAAGVPGWHPKQLRQRSITEWSRANATAGQLIHGCGIGVLSHYLDPLSVLESAAPQVRLPDCFGVHVDNLDRMRQVYSSLDPEGQRLVLSTAERMAH